MSLREILAAIEDEASQAVDGIRAESEREALALLASARERAATIEGEAETAWDLRLQAETERMAHSARLEAMRALRAAREDLLQSGLSQARSLLAAVREQDEYAAVLRALLKNALAALPEGDTLRVDPRDAQLAARLLEELGLDLRLEPSLSGWGGLILTSEEGREVHDTLEGRLLRADPLIRVQLASELTASR